MTLLGVVIPETWQLFVHACILYLWWIIVLLRSLIKCKLCDISPDILYELIYSEQSKIFVHRDTTCTGTYVLLNSTQKH